MSESIFSTIKLIKAVGKFFGFFPFKLDKSHKNFKFFYIINWIYASFIIFNLTMLMYFNFTIFSDFLQESALIPILVNRFSQTIPVTVNIVQTLGIFIHMQSFYKLSELFKKIDEKVICLRHPGVLCGCKVLNCRTGWDARP